MEAAKKKRAMLAVVCVALVALIAAAGTVAYLQAESAPVTNTFRTNDIEVSLEETTGSNYNIVPGTTEEKDPKVTVTATVDSYVFVEVTDTANTGDATVIEYSLENGWIPLEGYDDVYYREVSANDQAREFNVIAGNKVSYPSTLTNADMPTGDVTLTFKASAIQKDPFNDPVRAYKMSAPTEVSSGEDLQKAISKGGAASLVQDVSLTTLSISEDVDAAIDLNGHTLTLSGANTGVALGSDLYIANGSLEWKDNRAQVSFALVSGAELTLDSVDFKTDDTINVEAGTDPATLNVINSTIESTDYYCVSTNAANNATGENVIINIENSTLTADETHDGNNDCTAVLFNIPGQLNISNSTITADRQAVIVRCGTANIENSTLTCTGNAPSDWHTKYDNVTWGSGNEVPVAVLVAGNRSNPNSYPYDAAVTLINTTLTYSGDTARSLVYAAAYNGHTTTVNGISESSCTISKDDSSTVTINS